MNERVTFVASMLEAEQSFSDLCARFGISRKQGYKWKRRYESGGVEALADRSRAPHSHPRHFFGGGAAVGDGTEEAPAMGSAEAPRCGEAPARASRAAVRPFCRGDLQEARARQKAAEGTTQRPVQGSPRAVRRTESSLVRGLQGKLSHAGARRTIAACARSERVPIAFEASTTACGHTTLSDKLLPRRLYTPHRYIQV
jgi:hypothetical protein